MREGGGCGDQDLGEEARRVEFQGESERKLEKKVRKDKGKSSGAVGHINKVEHNQHCWRVLHAPVGG